MSKNAIFSAFATIGANWHRKRCNIRSGPPFLHGSSSRKCLANVNCCVNQLLSSELPTYRRGKFTCYARIRMAIRFGCNDSALELVRAYGLSIQRQCFLSIDL